jgi:CheY-like chemotaxis protein
MYANDPKLRTLLEHIAEDEAWHYHVMRNAADLMTSNPEIVSAISIDEATKNKIERYFAYIKDGLDNNTISRDELIEKIVEVELSEWNYIFLYVVNALKEKTSEFKYQTASIQGHIKEIEHFLETVENRPETLQQIKQLPPVWVENILIVDDDHNITELLDYLLNREGYIDIVHNGREAMELIHKKYYKLIISDIDMPIMDGLSLFKEAVSKFPSLSSRFLFVSGDLSPERMMFFDTHQLQYIAKPMQINVLREQAKKLLLS